MTFGLDEYSPHRWPGPWVPTRHHHIATVTKDFAQYRVYHPFTSRTASTRAVIDFQSASKCFFDVALVPDPWSGGGGCRTCTGTHSYSTTTHCKVYLSLASPFLLFFNASIFFSHFIFFSLLCYYRLRRWHCLWSTFDTFCFWACNSLYFILIFLLL